MIGDPALETLVLPLETGQIDLAEGARVLFMRARAGLGLSVFDGFQLTCEQSFAPDRDALQAAGRTVVPEADGGDFDAVFVLPSRQRQEARAQLARAAARVRSGGVVAACAPNAEGAKTLESDFTALMGGCGKLVKNKCRAVWQTVEASSMNASLIGDWQALDAARAVMDGAFHSRPGLFAWDRVDPATALLIRHLPDTLSGRGADLGAGFGVLAKGLLDKAAKVASLDLYEAEKRGLDLAEKNLAAYRDRMTLTGIWSDVTRGIDGPYDFIVTNPPFHQTGSTGRTDIGQGFIRAAADGLRPGGVLFLVANRHLPYEHTLKDLFASADMVADEGGYKVIRAVKGKGKR
ncbi:16S rRNA methyltransferase [Roseibium aquae]|uniref:16S rRNA methyltransferase n=1 Tax=Roseibium aquae TaxID=1323746 RepID=A0A916TJU0_9HYPH|nr:methyltransferase [Roseibium aquae]GGB49666.1 16S rRNA methyltransferase [Roseibium aquae]